MKNYLTIILFLCGICNMRLAFSQNPEKFPSIIPPSPSSVELGRFGNIPINESTGAMNLSIPLFNFSTKNISLPITLSYSSNGLDVNKIGSRAGFDWILNSGGVITRTVYDQPDESPGVQKVMEDPNTSIQNQDLMDYLTTSVSGGWDNQMDIFNYNFNGYSGRFFFERNDNIILLPHTNLRIEIIKGIPNVFKITTPDGISYYFGGVDATEYTNVNTETKCMNYEGMEPDIESSWYLNRIEHPSGDYVSFNYETINLSYRNSVTERYYYLDPHYRKCTINTDSNTSLRCSNYENKLCSNYIDIASVRLKSITSSQNDSIIFSYKRRKDIGSGNDGIIDEIILKSRSNRQIRRIILSHYESISVGNYTNSDERYRYFLTGILEYGQQNILPKEYKFYYKDLNSLPARLTKEQDLFGFYNGKSSNYYVPFPKSIIDKERFYKNGGYIGGDKSPDYNFSSKGIMTRVLYPTNGYNEIVYEPNDIHVTNEIIYDDLDILSLSSEGNDNYPESENEINFTAYANQNSPQLIHAEFINNNQEIDEDPHIRMEVLLINNTKGTSKSETLYLGEKKDISSALAAGNNYTLKIQIYGFSGHYGFAYVKVYPEPRYFTGNKEMPGLRVKKITSFDSNGTLINKSIYDYSYLEDSDDKSSGIVVTPESQSVLSMQTKVAYSSSSTFVLKTCDCNYLVLEHSTGGGGARALDGNRIMYKSVIVRHDENMTEGGKQLLFKVERNQGNINIMGNDIQNGILNNTGYANGQILENNTFKLINNNPVFVRKEKYYYEEDSRVNNNHPNYLVKQNYWVIGEKYIPTDPILFAAFDVSKYYIHQRWNYLKRIEVTDYDISSGAESLVRSDLFEYSNSVHTLPTKIKKERSDGAYEIIERIYPHDIGLSGDEEIARNQLIDNHQIAELIKERKINKNSIRESRNVFSQFYNGIVKKRYSIIKTSLTSKYDTILYFDKYSNSGNLLDMKRGRKEPITSFIYFYGEEYPSAEAINASSNQIAHTSFETSEKGGWTYSGAATASTTARTGKYIYHLGSGAITKSSYGASSSDPATVTLWARRSSGSGNWSVMGKSYSLSTSWQLIEFQVTGGTITIPATSGVYIDELRLHPADAQMTTYTYEPLVGMTSQTDARNYTTYYEYDDFGRLETIKDENGKILEHYEYNYATSGN